MILSGRPRQREPQGVGEDPDARRFVLAVLLITRLHLADRPISSANEVYFRSRAGYCDRLLRQLQAGRSNLAPEIEEGLARLSPISGRDPTPQLRRELSREFGLLYDRHFRNMSLPCSHWRPVNGRRITDWPQPGHILFAVGPNIGIGDEMILFLAVEALRRRYPSARLEVWSHADTLWDWLSKAELRYVGSDPLAPFVRAQRLLREDPSALVGFSEFATTSAYRHLETVPGFDRFFFLDTGSRVLRLVDQQCGEIAEYSAPDPPTIYQALGALLSRAGLTLPELGLLRSIRTASSVPQGAFKLFVSPFSSKDYTKLEPVWWARILSCLGRKGPLEVEILSGLNEQSRRYAQGIGEAIESGNVQWRLEGKGPDTVLRKVIESALKSDLVLGLDTFTAHLSILRKIPSVTIFFGSSGNAWRVPGAPVLGATIFDQPEHVADLADRLLRPPPQPDLPDLLEKLLDQAEAVGNQLSNGALAGGLREGLAECSRTARRLAALDPGLPETFRDVPISHYEFLERSLGRQTPSAGLEPAFKKVLSRAWESWENCNLCRYADHVSAVWCR